MRVHYTLTLINAVVRGKQWEKLEVHWDECHISPGPLAIPLAWAATREYVLATIPIVTAVEEAHLEIAFP